MTISEREVEAALAAQKKLYATYCTGSRREPTTDTKNVGRQVFIIINDETGEETARFDHQQDCWDELNRMALRAALEAAQRVREEQANGE